MKNEGRVKNAPLVSVVFLMLLTWGSWAHADKIVFVSLGTNNTDSLGEQSEFGLEMEFIRNDWPINLVVGYRASRQESNSYLYTSPTYGRIISNNEAFTSELTFGVRKRWGGEVIQPFLGGGLAIVNASMDYSIETESVYCDMFGCFIYSFGYDSDHTQALGLWLDGGIHLIQNENFIIGLNVRWTKAEERLFDADVEVGGTHIGIQVGFHY